MKIEEYIEQSPVQVEQHEEEKIESLLDNVKEKYPSLEKIYESGKTTLKLLTAIVMFGVGPKLFAQENPERASDSFWSSENLEKLKEENIETVYGKLSDFKISIPKEKITASLSKKEITRFGEGNTGLPEGESSVYGQIPDSAGVVGDLAVATYSGIVRKEQIRRTGDGKENATAGKISSFSTEISKEKVDVDSSIIKIRDAEGRGKTREEALFGAIHELAEQGTIQVDVMKMLERHEEKTPGKENADQENLSVISIAGLNRLDNVRVISEKIIEDGIHVITVEGGVVRTQDQ